MVVANGVDCSAAGSGSPIIFDSSNSLVESVHPNRRAAMKVDTIVKAPHFLTLEGDGVGYRAGIALVVDRGRIVDLAEAGTVGERYQAEEVLDLPHHVVLPGLIDAHVHLGICILRGLA